jgi:glutamate-1-semialdehyde 2,1-aminomutase
MHEDGWWWCAEKTTNKAIRRRILREMLAHRF